MSSGYSLFQETADSIDEVTLCQVPTARKNFITRALKGVESSRLMASASREMSAGPQVIKDRLFKQL